jgi:uncharacterized protein with FMN-binding domain
LKKRVDDGTVKGGQVLQGERASIDEVKARILKSDVRRTIQNYEIEEADAKVGAFLIKHDEKDVDLLREATMAHESIIKALWEYNLSKGSTIQFSGSSNDYDSMKE